jgi:Zn-dependent peptidase ImmA (M78 family)/DNA-binding XRE family transcriptional regulator
MPANPVLPLDPPLLGARIRTARESGGMTQQEVAERLGLSRTTVVAIEKGERRLKPGELVAIAALLGRNVSDFLQKAGLADGFESQLRASHSRLETQDAELASALEEFQRRCEEYLRLEEICEAPLRRRYPAEYEIQGSEPEAAAEDVAWSERRRLDLGEGPLLRLGGILEGDVGIRVFQLEMPSQVAGVFACAEPFGACIAVNLRHAPQRRRVSLAHEYGHFLTARFRPEITLQGRFERRPPTERFAEAFARSFLLPAAGLRKRFHELERERPKGVTFGDLCRLAYFYFVPLEATTRRLEELRLVPAGTWDRLRRERLGVRQIERLLSLQESPAAPENDEPFSPRYVGLAVEAWQRGELSEGMLARVLRTDRLGARIKVQELGRAAGDGGEAGAIDLGEPLFRAR